MPRQDKGIFWLASYPKSGNTWFRIFLANLLNTSEDPVDLNAINTGAIASARCWIDKALGFNSGELSHDELDKLRPTVYQWYGEQAEGYCYHKIHDAYTEVNSGTGERIPLIPQEGSIGVIYFIRNPLDVAISFANHSNYSIDKAIDNMGDETFAFCKGKYKQHNQLRQCLLSWSLHVQSWVNAQAMNLLVLRYEDMTLKPMETFTKAVRFLQIDVTEEAIAKALDNARIDKLQALEDHGGFCEKPAKVARFFRKGIINDWQNTLSSAQIERVIADHGDTMKVFGYLDEHHQPIIL